MTTIPWVLTLGDGSLSFSNAYSMKYRLGRIPLPEQSDAGSTTKKHPQCYLVATTFDSPSTLLLKYIDAQGYKTRIKQRGGLVLGSVDATNIINTMKSAYDDQV